MLHSGSQSSRSRKMPGQESEGENALCCLQGVRQMRHDIAVVVVVRPQGIVFEGL